MKLLVYMVLIVMTLLLVKCSGETEELLPVDTEDYFDESTDLGEIDTGRPNNIWKVNRIGKN